MLDGSDGKRLLNCLSRSRILVEQFSGEEQTVGEWTMLDTAQPPRRTSSTPAKRDSAGSATQHTTAICTDTIMCPCPSAGPRLLQIAAYDIVRESKTKDGKPPAELPEFIQKELLHPKTCEYCRRLGMVQTLLPKPNRPLEPSEQISWGKTVSLMSRGSGGPLDHRSRDSSQVLHGLESSQQQILNKKINQSKKEYETVPGPVQRKK